MSLKLQGNTTIKAGEDIVVKAEFEADQAGVDQVVAERVNRAKQEKETEISDLKKKLETAGSTQGETATLKEQIKVLQEQQITDANEAKLNKALRKTGALDLEDEFLSTIKVAKDDDDSAVEGKVKAAVKRRDEMRKKWGGPASTGSSENGTGRSGNGGSQDEEPENKKHAEMLAKITQLRPDLVRWVEKQAGKEAQLKLMQSYESQGLLAKKTN